MPRPRIFSPRCILPSAFCLLLLFAFSPVLRALPPDVDPALFPGLDKIPPADLELAGLAALYPGRLLHEPPATTDPSNPNRLPYSRDISHSLTYLRIYDLASAQAKLADALTHPTVILDLRYLTSSPADAEAFADTLAKAGLPSAPVKALGDLPVPAALPTLPAGNTTPPAPPLVLALVNHQTSGPLEAWLAAFQAADSVLAIGSPTAGQPGIYRPVQSSPTYYILVGELQPSTGSLVGPGLQPRFAVDVTPEQNYRAYVELERGADLPSLLTPAHAASVTPSTDDTTDLVLQRAVDIVAALQLLGRVPSLPTPAPPPSPPAPPGP
jgi:hypothetical protein